MPRRRPPQRRRPADRPPSAPAQRIEAGPDGHDYQVVAVTGARATKTYRCPGCDHEVRSGTAHVVVWRVEDAEGADRRHWHTPCWAKRHDRGPTRRWS